ncbi:MAG: FG-GAP-like repeat-containing protein [Isosphaerales bacterium]
MSTVVRFALIGLSCAAVGAGAAFVVISVVMPDRQMGWRPAPLLPGHPETQPSLPGQGMPQDTDALPKPGGRIIDRDQIDDGGFGMARQYTGSIPGPGFPRGLREVIRARGRVGLAVLRAELDHLRLGPRTPREPLAYEGQLLYQIGLLEMYEGRFSEAAASFQKSLEVRRTGGLPPRVRAELMALQGIVAMRQGEVDNQVASFRPSSGIFPIEREAIHTQQAGSRAAIKHFTAYLEKWPDDLRIRWLLNLAYMTLGEYPAKVPPAHLIPLDRFRSKIDVGRFDNVAPRAGLNSRGPNLAGGSVFDDFTGDGLTDLFTTSLDAGLGATLYVNRGDGGFEDRSAAAGLGDQVYAVNVSQVDFDNDGDLDVLLLRGASENPMRLSLLRNNGAGIFDDVTIASGLGEPLSTESAAWGDYDDDGLVDLFVCGEYTSPASDPGTSLLDPRNRCRLYHNSGNGTFENVAVAAGVTNERCAKGSAWGDYDGDGRLDLFVSNFDGPCRLYHNDGNGTFHDVASQLGVAGPSHEHSFACWFWDFDNDGRLDLFVNDYSTPGADVVAHYLGLKGKDPSHPRLYRNLGDQGFRDVSLEAGLDWPIAAMGANFGDVDNDGYLDAYFGTGWMSYSGLVPNVMLKNVEGRRFEDVTESSRTGHLQKGHGVSFADWDCDGDLDLFVVLGGISPGDQAYNILFQNPGHGRHWLKVKLVGTRTNRSALGARLQVELKGPDGAPRSIYRVIGNNSSFGGNSLVETIGLAGAKFVTRLTVYWPTSRTSQSFRDVAAGQAIEITEGTHSFRVLHQPPIPSPSH